MAPPVRRRYTPVHYAKELINAILNIRQQRQIPNFERISKYLQRYSDITPRRCKEHLNNAVSDGLIVEYTAVGFKGQRTGLEQEGYKIPQNDEIEKHDDGHDWYCFECHHPGEVYECNDCFRVYHQGCTREDTTGDTFVCSVCRVSRKKNKMKKKMLNTLLSYTILHLREKTRELQKIETKSNTDDFKKFVYKKMDLRRIEAKVQASRYKCLEEFHADARTILHNCTLVYGEEKGGMTDLAAHMVKDCKYDLDEIELCPNCYYMSNAKPEDWFSQPCNPTHDLVYAKQKGYSYWPAKVVRDLGGKSDVRFFGGWHQRAIIPAEYIKPITTDLKAMTIKRTAGFVKAVKELKRHQEILEEKENELNGQEEDEQDEEEEEEEPQEMDQSRLEEGMEEEAPTPKSHKKAKKESDQCDGVEPTEEEEEEYEEEPVKKHTPKKAIRKKKESSQGRPKKTQKRVREEEEEVCEQEDDLDNRQVTSTSVDRSARKKQRKSAKYNSQDELSTVTSSEDKVSMTPPVPTFSIAIQTLDPELESASTQTEAPMEEEKEEEKEEKLPSKVEKKEATPIKKEDPPQVNEKLVEERIATALFEMKEKMREQHEQEKDAALKQLSDRLEEDFGKDKQQAVERALGSMKQEVEKARKAGEDRAKDQYKEEMRKLEAKHREQLSQTKKKQWCQFCEEEAMYHCCWNTSYCSVKCQQDHWHKDHKRVCRRKRS